MRRFSALLLVGTTALLAACGQREEATQANATAPGAASTEAAGAGPAGLIKVRQENLKKLGGALKPMSDELKKSDPQLAVFQTNVQTIAALAPELHSWFPAGTGPEVGVETEAKPDIWARPAEFQAKADALAAEAQKFNATVQSGDMVAIRAGVGQLGATCKSCHEQFREQDR